MNKKKILFVLNHFEFSNGVASTLRSLIDNLDQDKFEVHILPLYKYDAEFIEPIKEKVTVHSGFGLYFRGLDKAVDVCPKKLLYKLLVRDNYDLEVAFQFGISTKMISSSPNPNKVCWMHGYDTNMVLRKFYHKFLQIICVSKIGKSKL